MEEISFPRGGRAAAAKSTGEEHIKRKKPNNENLFKEAGDKKRKRQKKKANDPDAAFLGITKELKKAAKLEKAQGGSENTVLSAEPLSHKILAEDMTVLSRVQEIRDTEVLLSLPGRILATVPLTNISKPYTKLMQEAAEEDMEDIKGLKEMFSVGELLACSIRSVAKDGSFKVVASLNPADVNKDIPAGALETGMRIYGAVQSIEDHGYVMDLGIVNARAFLPDAEQKLSVGQIIPCTVSRCVVDGATANVTLADARQEQKHMETTTELKVATLLPGSPVKATVEKVLSRGLLLSFGKLKGYVHKDHFPDLVSEPGKFSPGQHVNAVVLYNLPLVNALYLTLKPSIVQSRTDVSADLKAGDFVENAQVTESTNAGLFLLLRKNFRGYVPARHLKDSGEVMEDVHLVHPVGSSKRCRILQYSAMDEVYICTMKKSLLKQTALRYEDFSIGQLVTARVESLNSNGVNVSLGKNLHGFIPRLHWADDPRLKKPEFRFHTSIELQCRVLKVDAEKKQIILTCKKTIVEDEKSIVWSMEQLKPGLKLQGTVTLVRKNGLLVSFFGDLSGWVPKSNLSRQNIEDATRNFYTGQIVKCTVKNVIQSSGKVTLALGDEDVKVEQKSLPVGMFVACKVETAVQEPSPGLEVSVVDSELKGFVPLDHLSDFPFLCQHLLQSYVAGDAVEAVVWKHAKPEPMFSMKPSLVRLAKEKCLPKNAEDVRVGSVYPCVFSIMQNFGALAEVLHPSVRQTVLFPKSKIGDNLKSFLEENKGKVTIYGKVLSAKTSEKKIALTAKVDHKDETLLENYLRQVEKIHEGMKNHPDEALRKFANLQVGSSLVGRVEEVVDNGVRIKTENGFTAVISEYHCAGRKLKKNDLVVGAVLHWDVATQTLYGTLRNEILSKMPPKPSKIQPGTSVKGTVIFTGDLFGLVLLKGKKAGIVYVPLIDNLNDIYEKVESSFRLGSEIDVVMAFNETFPIARLEKSVVNRKRTLSKTSNTASPQAKKEKLKPETKPPVEEVIPPPPKPTTNGEVARLQVTSQFSWDDDIPLPLPTAETIESSSEDDESDSEVQEEKSLGTSAKDRKERARQKREKAREEESKLAAAEQNLLNADRNPQTSDDFDRMVLASPDSSILWLQYMAFHLENAEIEQARAVVQRALKTINFREEQEKFNVWIAWLNLEHLYGTTESYDKVFEEALRCNEPLKVYKQMAMNFAQSGKFEEAQNLFNIMTKKFKRTKEVWISACTFYMKNSKPETARDVFQRSLLSIDKKEHVDMISRFAQLESRYGEPERCKTMFDTLLVSYPKRTDLWMVYVDTLTKAGDIDGSRQVLERAASLQLPPKKMKAIFQKFLDFETAHGDEDSQENVRQKALNYIESKNIVDE